MIQNLRRADQAYSGTTDATRTERDIGYKVTLEPVA
jgi:hypothetical protein